jgi:hypothetical protein
MIGFDRFALSLSKGKLSTNGLALGVHTIMDRLVNLELIWPEGYRSDPGKHLLVSASFFTGVTTLFEDLKMDVEKI